MNDFLHSRPSLVSPNEQSPSLFFSFSQKSIISHLAHMLLRIPILSHFIIHICRKTTNAPISLHVNITHSKEMSFLQNRRLMLYLYIMMSVPILTVILVGICYGEWVGLDVFWIWVGMVVIIAAIVQGILIFQRLLRRYRPHRGVLRREFPLAPARRQRVTRQQITARGINQHEIAEGNQTLPEPHEQAYILPTFLPHSCDEIIFQSLSNPNDTQFPIWNHQPALLSSEELQSFQEESLPPIKLRIYPDLFLALFILAAFFMSAGELFQTIIPHSLPLTSSQYRNFFHYDGFLNFLFFFAPLFLYGITLLLAFLASIPGKSIQTHINQEGIKWQQRNRWHILLWKDVQMIGVEHLRYRHQRGSNKLGLEIYKLFRTSPRCSLFCPPSYDPHRITAARYQPFSEYRVCEYPKFC
jgi:hypothetical protein